MKKYQILQGKFTSGGCGDYTIIAEYDTLKEAKTAFNYLKSKYYVVFEDIFYNDDLSCYTMQVRYVEKGIC